MTRPTLLLLALAACTAPGDETTEDTGPDTSPPETLTALGFNVESGGANADTVADVIRDIRGEGLWGTVETLDASWAETFATAAADEGVAFEWIMGTTGWEDRIVILWDDDRYALVSHEELQDINVGGTARAPLVAHMQSRESGVEFLFMVNHLWRTDTNRRHQQAQLLNTWALQQTLPVIAVGDYNFDWEVVGGDSDHDRGYDLMTANGAWEWVRPEVLITTQCSTSFESVLDFVFVAGEAQTWQGTSEIVEVAPNYCPDNTARSDHRPVRGDFVLP